MNNIDLIAEQSHKAFMAIQKKPLADRIQLLRQIALEIEALGDELLETASEESHLPLVRFQGERARTCGQLRMFASLLEKGDWEHLSIDTAMPDRQPLPKPDIRQGKLPIGVIVVFGASNFPLAYSTCGGDTASALAAGCSVIYKIHPAHPKTSALVNQAIQKAIQSVGFPEHTFIHYSATDNDDVKRLVQHELIQGIGFTGSYHGGMAIYGYTKERKQPIPVFAEMGSVNPVIFCPEALAQKSSFWAEQYAASITAGVGQFCTNPGLLFGIKSPSWEAFKVALGEKMSAVRDFKMLNEGIFQNYSQRLEAVINNEAVGVVNQGQRSQECAGVPVLAETTAKAFLQNPILHEEVFGPFSMSVECDDEEELIKVCAGFSGQLTTTIIAEPRDYPLAKEVLDVVRYKAGRVNFNAVPTGVEVCDSMVHGGPFPATTEGRFTSVGASAIDRWVRPIAYQNFPQELLPENLRDTNIMSCYRKINGEITK